MGEVEEFEVKFLSREQRKWIYDAIFRVNCITTIKEAVTKTRTKKGVTTTEVTEAVTKGINAEWLEKKLMALVEDRPYGETDAPGDGHLRPILSIFWTREGASSPVSAFAVVCAPSHDTYASPATVEREHRFHRLRHEHVDNSVYLAILCGSGATRIMDFLVKRYEDKVITLDSLPHAIPYYLRPNFGVARMIDTEASFRRSIAIQQEYAVAKSKQHKMKVREKALRLKSELLKAEEFTPLAECAERGRAEETNKVYDEAGKEIDYYTYLYAHIVILPAYLRDASFDDLCKHTVDPTGRRKRVNATPSPPSTRPQREKKPSTRTLFV
jgi:hypothetical protein